MVEGPTGAARFVTDRIAEGADYIKLIVDTPGPDQEILDALVAASQRHRRLTVAHATSTAALDMALQAGVDMITHAPLDRLLTESTAARVLAQKCVMIPTLTMMKGIVDRVAALAASQPEGVSAAGPSYESARDSVAELHRAGSHPATAKACTTSSNCSSKLACRPARRCARAQCCQHNTSGYTTGA